MSNGAIGQQRGRSAKVDRLDMISRRTDMPKGMYGSKKPTMSKATPAPRPTKRPAVKGSMSSGGGKKAGGRVTW